jgi:hypothetical protein
MHSTQHNIPAVGLVRQSSQHNNSVVGVAREANILFDAPTVKVTLNISVRISKLVTIHPRREYNSFVSDPLKFTECSCSAISQCSLLFFNTLFIACQSYPSYLVATSPWYLRAPTGGCWFFDGHTSNRTQLGRRLLPAGLQLRLESDAVCRKACDFYWVPEKAVIQNIRSALVKLGGKL